VNPQDTACQIQVKRTGDRFLIPPHTQWISTDIQYARFLKQCKYYSIILLLDVANE
jgi:hypothetical protein